MNKEFCNKRKKGFIFSMEAALSLLLIGMMLLSLSTPHPVTMKELLIIQQENDLLKIWSAQGFSETNALQDVKAAFGSNAELIVGGHVSTINGRNVISSEAVLLTDSLSEIRVRILVQLD